MSTKNKNIEVLKNKTLKLHNVVTKTLTGNENRELQKTLQLFEGFIKAKALTPRGPLIVKVQPVTNDGATTIQTSVITQVDSNTKAKFEFPYEYAEEVQVPNCLFCRFNGEQEYLQIAYSKLQVYAYENDIRLNGTTYTIYIANKDGMLACDIFTETKDEK